MPFLPARLHFRSKLTGRQSRDKNISSIRGKAVPSRVGYWLLARGSLHLLGAAG